MRITTDRNPGAFAVDVRCIRCGRVRRLSETTQDREGPSFAAYFCEPCTPTSDEDAASVYEAAGYALTREGWRR